MRRKKRRAGLFALLFIFIIAAAFLAVALIRRYSPGKERADLNAYFGITEETQTAIVIDGQVADEKALERDGVYYLPLQLVQSALNSRFYFSEDEGEILYALSNELLTVTSATTDAAVTGNGGLVLLWENNTAYLALPFVEAHTDMTGAVYTEPNRLVITASFGERTAAKAEKDTAIREKGGIKSPILSELQAEEEVFILETLEDWTKVLSEDGVAGYVQNSALSEAYTRETASGFVEEEYARATSGEKVCMGWLQVTNETANTLFEASGSIDASITAVAPTWLFVQDVSGNISSLTSDGVVRKVHEAGADVWVTVNDFDGGIASAEETLELLRHTASRQNLTAQIMAAALSCGADGVNVDFEKVNEDCGEHYIQFIRELTIACRQNALTLSVDSYVPSDWTTQYRRDEQAVFADYVVIMAYDENGSWSTKKGPNSSLSYVSEAITDALQQVPAEKLIMALPLYDKLWEEVPVAGTNEVTLSCTSISMETAAELLAAHGAVASLDEDAGQNFVCYEENGNYYSLWLEDTTAVGEKLSLIRDADLAGVAFWRLGQETADIWPLVQQYYP